jgi:eukaryotic-like serine/threonine-protein kinase
MLTPEESSFVQELLESGVISYADAGSLERDLQDRSQDQSSPLLVWDLAVEKGLLSSDQAREFMAKLSDAVDAVSAAAPAPAVEDSLSETVPEKESDSRISLSGVSQSTDAGSEKRLGGYLLQTRLGKGAMGAVFKARQESMDRDVAIKVLPRSLANNQDFIQRFLREARAAGKLSHPNIVVGIDSGFADGYYYFAMEYVNGSNLGQLLVSNGRFSEDDATEYCLQIARALEHAHQEGIIHRDVKPENILLDKRGTAKLCDLGLARAQNDDMQLTTAGEAIGTPYYISPEQVRGLEPDFRSDIYSLGCTFYHLLTGKTPFTGANSMAVMQMHLNDRAVPVRKLVPEISAGVEKVISKMMAKTSAGRYQSAAEVVTDLTSLLAGQAPALASNLSDTRMRRRVGGTRKQAAVGSDTSITVAVSAIRSNPKIWIPVMAIALIAIVALTTALMPSEKPDEIDKKKKDPFEVKVQPDPDNRNNENDTDLLLLAQQEEFNKILAALEESSPDLESLKAKLSTLKAEVTDSQLMTRITGNEIMINKRISTEGQAQRLVRFENLFTAYQTFAKSNPEKFAESLKRFRELAVSAKGTTVEARAHMAGQQLQASWKAKGLTLLAALKQKIQTATSRSDYKTAQEALNAYPDAHRADNLQALEELKTHIAASGLLSWEDIASKARIFMAGNRFAEALRTAETGRKIGLSAVNDKVTALSAEINKGLLAFQARQEAELRKKYEAFKAEFQKLVDSNSFVEIMEKGKNLSSKLSGRMKQDVASDLRLAQDGLDLIKFVQKQLARVRPRSFSARLPMGGTGKFIKYEAKKDSSHYSFGAGGISHKTTDFKGELLVTLARRVSGGSLKPLPSRMAASYLILCGQTAQVGELLEDAARGKIDCSFIEARLKGRNASIAEDKARQLWETSAVLRGKKEWTNHEAKKIVALVESFEKQHGKTIFADGIKAELARLKIACNAQLQKLSISVTDDSSGQSAFSGKWTLLNPKGNAPSRRALGSSALTYDSKRGRAVFYGSHVPKNNDLWALNLKDMSWECLQANSNDAPPGDAPALQPPGPIHESHQRLHYDAAYDRYLFLPDWSFNPQTAKWENISDKTVVPGIAKNKMWLRPGVTIDAAGKRCFLVTEGCSGIFDLGKRSWTPFAALARPRWIDGAIIYDPDCKRLVIFGGYKWQQPHYNDTLLYDPVAKKWETLKIETSPCGRSRTNLVYHQGLKAIVLVGGYDDNLERGKDVWVFETSRRKWTEVKLSQPFISRYGGCIYDPINNQVLLLMKHSKVYGIKISRVKQ